MESKWFALLSAPLPFEGIFAESGVYRSPAEERIELLQPLVVVTRIDGAAREGAQVGFEVLGSDLLERLWSKAPDEVDEDGPIRAEEGAATALGQLTDEEIVDGVR